jgi:iron complex outermembrane receptor protein
MYFRNRFTGLMAVFFAISAVGQQSPKDSILAIDEVAVIANRYETLAVGATIQKLDSSAILANRSASLSELLLNYSIANINNYGSGGVSTASIRGGNAYSTPVVWNDINLQSPMNGQVNLSTIPVGLVDNVSIQNGGSGVIYGSGAMSGIIQLGNSNLVAQPDKIWISPGVGSFGNKNISGGIKLGNNKFASSIKAFAQAADNDFSFKNTTDFYQRTTTQSNAGVDQVGILQENMLKTSRQTILKTSCWLQHYDKDIQTMMTSANPNQSSQTDNSALVSGNWKYIDSSINLSIKSAYYYSQVLYYDEALDRTNNQSNSFINEVENKFVVTKHQALHIGVNNTFENASSEKYSKVAQRNRISTFAVYKLNQLINRLNIAVGLRDEYVEGLTPIVYSFGFDYQFSKKYKFTGNYSKNYRIPTLNDKFWKTDGTTSGNPNLKPESGWSSDVGFTEKLIDNSLSLSLCQNLFYSELSDWIIWQINSNSGKWTPENKDHGRSLGTEWRVNVTQQFSKHKIIFSSSYNWNQSRILKQNGNKVDLPLDYSPENRFNLSLGNAWKYFSIYYTHNITGVRQSLDRQLKPYQVADAFVNYKLNFSQTGITLTFRINNIWNELYQIREFYAMPMRNYQFSLYFDLFGHN